MALAYLTFFTGIAISLVAIYYSVMGLTAIFAAAVVPIIIMGTILEIAKLVTTVWLKQNWNRAPISLKAYLSVAVLVLMLITSMGIFGFLSKAHLDQGVPTGDVAAKVALLDEKIKTERDNIDAARKALAQMDASFEQTMSRSTSEQGADKAVAIRKSQAKERASLQKDIATAQTNITKLNEERAPIASELRKVEAEVGPIKYIAALIYGENPDQNILEKAVTWVIITIIFVFDPLAVLLLLASQYSFAWTRNDKKDWSSEGSWNKFFNAPATDFPDKHIDNDDEATRAAEANALVAEIEKEPEVEVFVESAPFQKSEKLTAQINTIPGDVTSPRHFGLDVKNDVPIVENTEADDDQTAINAADKEARRRWKEANPEGSIHLEERKKELGIISKLPWEDPESLERPGDYVQNSEQSKDTLWSRLTKRNDE